MTAVLTVEALGVTHAGRAVLHDMHLAVTPGEVVMLMGASGAGKSTVLRSIAALQPISAGRIDIGGFALVPGPLPRESRLGPLRRRVGMVFQAHALFEHLTARENIVLAPIHALGWTPSRAAERANALLDALGIAHRADALPRQLSGGEAQRVAIARALAPDPTLLLMDEPTSALDAARTAKLGATLRDLASAGRALLVTTHDRAFAAAYGDRIVGLTQSSTLATNGAD